MNGEPRSIDHRKQPRLSADALAQFYGFKNVVDMAQSQFEIPPHAMVLAIGKSADALGEEIAFYRSDIHWVNLDPAYTDNPPADERFNVEHIGWDVASLTDLFPEKHFDRIYCFDGLSDLATDPDAYESAGEMLVGLLKGDGKLAVSPVPQTFISNAAYDPKSELAVVRILGGKPQEPRTQTISITPQKRRDYKEKLRMTFEVGRAIGTIAVGCVIAVGQIIREKNN